MNKVIYIIIINEYDKRISKPFKKIHIFIRDVYFVCKDTKKLKNKVNAARKSKVDDNTAKMQSIKQLGV